MTDVPAAEVVAPARSKPERRMAPIVPPGNVAGSALILVIAIMTFLSCLTLGAVSLVRDTASAWES
ncbi:MAG: ABC transporter permease, partial [Rhizobiaceae bacterium]|nr:ABC transporter permease [Rhizobiaceae bacterium]